MQSRNLQFSIYLVKSGKSESRSFFCDNFGKSRVENPGVSSMKVVSFSNLKNRLSVVVWRPRSVFLLTVLVSRTSFPTNKFINVDLVNNPDLVASKYPLASAAYFFNSNKIWVICDKGTTSEIVKEVTKKVNGGTIGILERQKEFDKIFNIIK